MPSPGQPLGCVQSCTIPTWHTLSEGDTYIYTHSHTPLPSDQGGQRSRGHLLGPQPRVLHSVRQGTMTSETAPLPGSSSMPLRWGRPSLRASHGLSPHPGLSPDSLCRTGASPRRGSASPPRRSPPVGPGKQACVTRCHARADRQMGPGSQGPQAGQALPQSPPTRQPGHWQRSCRTRVGNSLPQPPARMCSPLTPVRPTLFQSHCLPHTLESLAGTAGTRGPRAQRFQPLEPICLQPRAWWARLQENPQWPPAPCVLTGGGPGGGASLVCSRALRTPS